MGRPLLVLEKPEDCWGGNEFWAPEIHKRGAHHDLFVSFNRHTPSKTRNRVGPRQVCRGELERVHARAADKPWSRFGVRPWRSEAERATIYATEPHPRSPGENGRIQTGLTLSSQTVYGD